MTSFRVVRSLRAVLMASVMLLAARAVIAQPSIAGPPTFMPAFGGQIKDMKRDGERLAVGGTFLGASPSWLVRGGLSIHDGVSGARAMDTGYVLGDVFASEPDGAGGYYIGGNFYQVHTAQRWALAHILPNGLPDPAFGPVVSRFGLVGEVYALARAGNTLFVGGDFNGVSSEPRSSVAAVDIATGAVLSFGPPLTGPGFATVSSLTVHDGVLYVGGRFDQVGGVARHNLAAFDIASGALLPWDPNVSGAGVSDIAIVADTMFVAGGFQAIGGQPRVNLAAIHRVSGALLSIEPPTILGGPVSSIEVVNGVLVAGGDFLEVGFANTRRRLAAFDASSFALLPWAPNANDRVLALARAGNTIYAGGAFTRLGGTDRAGAAAFDWSSNAGTLLPWNPSMNGAVHDLLVDGPRVALGGEFTAPEATVRRGLAIVDLATGQLSPFRAFELHGEVDAVGIVGNVVIAGGASLSVFAGYLLAFDAATGTLLSWAAPDAPVTVIETTSDRVYVGGSFGMIGAATRDRVAAYDLTGAVTPFVANITSGFVDALRADAVNLYIGGTFSAVNGVPRMGLAAVDRFSGAVGPLNATSLISSVSALAIEGNTLYVAGVDFLGGGPPNVLRSVDLTTGSLTGWTPPVPLGSVDTIAVKGGRAFLGGQFAVVGTAGRGYAAIIEPSGALLGVRIDTDGPVNAIIADEDRIIIGGSYDRATPFGYLTSNLAVFGTTVSQLPGPPAIYQVSTAMNQFQVTWIPPASGGAFTGYVLEGGLSSGTTFASVPLGDVLTFETALPSGTYFVRVRAVGPAGPGPASAEVQVVVPSCTPLLPPYPLAGSVSGNSVSLGWQPAGGAGVSYVVEAGTAPGLADIGVVPVGKNTTISATLPAGLYYARVRAVNACGASDPTNEVTLNVSAPAAPAAPTNLRVSLAGRVVTLAWDPPTTGAPVTNYVLEVGTSAATPTNVLVLPLGASTTLTSEAPPGTFHVRVRARNSVGLGPPSAGVLLTVP